MFFTATVQEKAGKKLVLTSRAVAEYAIKKMFLKKTVIVPGILMKFTRVLSKILPDSVGERAVYLIQRKKQGGVKSGEGSPFPLLSFSTFLSVSEIKLISKNLFTKKTPKSCE